MPNSNILQYLRSAIPLHSNYNDEAPFFGWNSLITAWTLTYELYFYLLFIISMSISHKFRTLICSSIILLSIFIPQLYFNGNISFSGNATANITGYPWHLNMLRLASSPMMIEFIYGMVLYELRYLYKYIPKPEIVVFIGVSFYICSFTSGFIGGFGPLNFGLWGLAIVLSALIYESNASISDNRLLTFLGNISYSLYMSHVIVIELFRQQWPNAPIYSAGSGFSRFLFLMSISLIVSYFAYTYIEKPFIKYGRKLITQLNSKNIKNDKKIITEIEANN